MSGDPHDVVGRARRFAAQRQTSAASHQAPTTAPTAETRIVARLREREPNMFAAAMARGPAPSMFHSGPVPPFLASGADPKLLNRLPEEIRHYAAKAGVEEFGRLIAQYADKPDADVEVRLFEPQACGDEGWGDYLARVREWSHCDVR